MVDTKLQDIIFYDDILSEQSMSYMSEREAWPLLGIRAKQDAPDTALETIYQEILNYTKSHTSHFQVFKRSKVPLRYHYSNNERIAPIVVIPDVGYVILHSEEHLEMPLGIHGYDNTAPEMRAIFVAKGPTIKQQVTLPPFYNIEVYSLISHLLGLVPSENNATLSVSEFIKSL
jgi:predicted AlkP superfamily pyrophosphatase or phosphodiesterase